MAGNRDLEQGTEREPFFGERGAAIRIGREARRPKLGGLYFFFWPLVSTVIMIFLTAVFWTEGTPLVLVVALVVNYLFASRYVERNTEPAMVLTLTEDGASVHLPDLSKEPVVTVPFGEDTLVDAVLNDAVRSREYGHLSGWTFERGDDAIEVSTHDDWDLWDIQGLREPVYRLLERHGMRRGGTLRSYQERPGGGEAKRTRSTAGPSPEPPTI